MTQGVKDFCMLGQRQMTPRRTNDPVWEIDGHKRREVRVMIGYPPPPPREDIGWRAEMVDTD